MVRKVPEEKKEKIGRFNSPAAKQVSFSMESSSFFDDRFEKEKAFPRLVVVIFLMQKFSSKFSVWSGCADRSGAGEMQNGYEST
jgi:hypothetical protein